MSARDTFEWFVSTQLKDRSPALEEFIRRQREYLFTLRSEDERQRFVEWAVAEAARLAKTGPSTRMPRPGQTLGK